MADSYGIGDGLKTTFANQLIVGAYNEFPWDDVAIIVANGTTEQEKTVSALSRNGDCWLACEDEFRETVISLGWGDDVLTDMDVE